ncbi:MAG: energy transducer TonB [Flavobacteriales bacterium]
MLRKNNSFRAGMVVCGLVSWANVSVNGQGGTIVQEKEQEAPAVNDATGLNDPMHIHTAPALSPAFPGGTEALEAYLRSEVRYPDEAREEALQGKVLVNFVVEPDGSITNVKVARGIHAWLDKEAVRVIKAMPKWEPGSYMKEGPSRVLQTLEISFRP